MLCQLLRHSCSNHFILICKVLITTPGDSVYDDEHDERIKRLFCGRNHMRTLMSLARNKIVALHEVICVTTRRGNRYEPLLFGS